MNASHHHTPVWRLSCLLIVASVLGQPGRAAAAIAQTVPELFAGELEDVGPQYLLMPKAGRQPLDLWTEFEFTRTSNATLVEENAQSSTVTSAQAGATWDFGSRPFHGGQLSADCGMRLQAYRYGYVTGRKQQINYHEIFRNDFNLIGAHLGARWERERWVANTTLRAASLRSQVNARTFYQEVAFEWQLFRQGRIGPQLLWALGLEGAMRWSNTDSYGLLPAPWNNRLEQGVVALLEQRLGARWKLQPAVRVLGTEYVYRDRQRSDVHASGRVNVIYQLAAQVDLRLGVGYDRRDSSEPTIADFEKWDAGVTGSAHWKF